MPSPDLMTATRFYRQGEPLQIDQIPRPEPGPYDVLVNVEAVGICGSDIHITIEGTTPTPYQPITLGHEIAGTIERLGSAVSGWTAGDRIVVNALVTDGTCTQCLNGRSEVCLTRTAIGIHTDGAWLITSSSPPATYAGYPTTCPPHRRHHHRRRRHPLPRPT